MLFSSFFYSEISYIVGSITYLLLNGRWSVFSGGNLESLQGLLQAVLSLCSLISFSTSLPFAHSAPPVLPLEHIRQSSHHTVFALAVPFLQRAVLLDIPLTKSLTTFKFQPSVSFLMRPTCFGLFNTIGYFPSFVSTVLNSSTFYLALLFFFLIALSHMTYSLFITSSFCFLFSC